MMGRASRELLLPLKAFSLNIPVERLGVVTAASFALDVALVPIAGYVMDKFGRKHATVPALFLTALGFALMAISASEAMLLVSALVLGVGNGMSNGWVQTVGVDLAPVGSRAQFLGVWNLLMGLGQTVGPLLVGGISQLLSIDFATAVICLVSTAGGLWYLFVGQETKPDSASEAPSLPSFVAPPPRRHTRFLPGLRSRSSDEQGESKDASDGYVRLRP